MLEPSTEEEWAFLRRCALNEYEDGWVDGGAIGILRLNSFPRSLEILREASQKNPSRQGEIRRAIEFINSQPPLLTDPDLIEAGRKVAQAIRIGEWQTNRPPTFNEGQDKALIACEFIAGRDLLVYTATFHKMGELWRLRGVRETMQALLASPPPKSSFLGAWLGYSSGCVEFARLELFTNGTGLFALSELPNTAPGSYRISRWSPEGSKLEVALETADPEAEAIRLEDVLCSSSTIEFTVRGVHGDWSRTMTLFRETEFQRRAKEVKKSLEKLKKGK